MLAIDSVGTLCVADGASSTIRCLALATLQVTTRAGIAGHAGFLPGPLPASLDRPDGLAMTPAGTMLVADGAADVIASIR